MCAKGSAVVRSSFLSLSQGLSRRAGTGDVPVFCRKPDRFFPLSDKLWGLLFRAWQA